MSSRDSNPPQNPSSNDGVPPGHRPQGARFSRAELLMKPAFMNGSGLWLSPLSRGTRRLPDRYPDLTLVERFIATGAID